MTSGGVFSFATLKENLSRCDTDGEQLPPLKSYPLTKVFISVLGEPLAFFLEL